MAKRQYYTLAVREDGYWSAEFGDHDKQVVWDELQDYRDRGFAKRDLMIVKTDDAGGQPAIDEEIGILNALYNVKA